MKYLPILVVALLLSLDSAAQRLTVEATIKQGDTERTVQFLTNSFNQESNAFSIREDGETKVLTSNDIDHIILPDNEKYVSKTVETIKGSNKKISVTQKVFLKLLEEGDVDLFTYQNNFVYIASQDESPQLLYMERQEKVRNEIGTVIEVISDKTYDMNLVEGLYEIKKTYLHDVKKRLRKEVVVKPTVRLEGKSIRRVVENHNTLQNSSKSYFTRNFKARLNLGVKTYISQEIPEDANKQRLNLALEIQNPSLSKSTSIIFSYANKVIDSDKGVVMLGVRQYFHLDNRIQPYFIFGFNTFGRNSFIPYYEGGINYQLSQLSIYAGYSVVGIIERYGYEAGIGYVF